MIPGHPCALWRVGQAVPPVIGHPEIAGECQPRDFEKHSRADLPQVVQASRVEMLALIERHQLYGSGCAIVDAMILASTLLTPGATLWTLDKSLVALADELGVLYPLARS